MSGDNKNKGDESEKRDQADFPTLSLPGSGELSDSPTALLGTRIGSYKLVSVLGEGGFGIVYRAEQEEPVRRDVALKIIKPGMDSIQVIGRFEAERQTLAWLDHPNIAHIYDGGTTEAGRPYFVMEYVEGTPITEYCDEQKLSVKERLELFEQVCKAAQHAHQKGITHRDIKPSNVLVSLQDDKPVPKIIDFGIAKAVSQSLTERTFTEKGQFVGTLEYMSPEQATLTNQDIDTRSDIYSLGVLLYELLTGTLPFDSSMLNQAAFDERLRIIREEDPPRPSTRLSSLGEEAQKIAKCRQTQVAALTKYLHKELEWIPLMAMRKERTRRYQSASEFAQDIRNYMNGNPLIAGPESMTYRARKFARKHTGLLVSAASILILLVVSVTGFVFSTTMYISANQAKKAEQQRAEEYRRSLYVNRINLTQKYYDESNIGHVHELLRACPNDLREWEWYYLWRLLDQAVMTLRGASGVFAVGFSPDGKRIVSAGNDMVKVCDAKSGSELMALRGYRSAGFSPDGRRIVSIGLDMTLKIWDADNGGELMTLPGDKRGVFSVAFSPDSKRIVSLCDHTIKIWDADNGTKLVTLEYGKGFYSVAFNPDGRWIISGGRDGTIKVWDAESGADLMTLRGHEGPVFSVAFSPDGRQIVSGSWDNTLKVWDAESGSELMTLRGHNGNVVAVAYSPDGRHIVSGSEDSTLKIWDAKSGNEVTTLWGQRTEVWSAAFSPDGRWIVSAGADGTLKVWDAEIGILRGHRGSVCSVAFSPDGRRIVSGSEDHTLKIWDVYNCTEMMILWEHYGGVTSVAFSPDGRWIISGSGDNNVKVWDATSGACVITLPLPRRGHKRGVRSVKFSPDGKWLVSGSQDGTLKVWDAQTGSEMMTLRGHNQDVSSVEFSPDGKRIVSGSWDSTLKVWDAHSGSELMTLRGHQVGVASVAFSPDGRRITSGSWDNTLKVWDAHGGNELITLHSGSQVNSVAFSPDGKRIISGGYDGTVKVWDAESGAELITLRGHKGRVESVAFSPDGRRIVSGSADGTVKVWNSACPEVAAEQLAKERGISWIRKDISK